ncbi:MAG TPA: EamA family transporter [Thermomicrobiales bacterium]|nr:EamA family transporter [Thermomicrobiales bacterium]
MIDVKDIPVSVSEPNPVAPSSDPELHIFDRIANPIPPPALMMIGMVSFQLGAAFSKDLFDWATPTGLAFLRSAWGAVFLFLIFRPKLRGLNRAQVQTILGMGTATACMGLLYFLALQRIPLGIATAIAFAGPFILAMTGARQLAQVVWVLVAASGVVLLAPWGSGGADPMGFVLAGLAGVSYTVYMLLTKRAGQTVPSNDALPLAMGVAAILMAPFGVGSAGGDLLQPKLLILVALTALLSNTLPYMLEFNALRRVSASVYAVLISLDPAVSAVAGLIVLGEAIGARGYVAIGLICLGSMMANRVHQRAARVRGG